MPDDYATIQAAITAWLGPDTQIVVRTGTYHEAVTIDSNKSVPSFARGVIKTDGGRVTLDGSLAVTEWTLHTGTVYWATAAIDTPEAQVTVDGVRYANRPEIAYSSLSTGEYRHDAAAVRVYLNAGGPDPDTKTVRMSFKSFGFRVRKANNWTIEGFTITRMKAQGIILEGRTGRAVTGCIVKNDTCSLGWGQGIRFEDASGCVATNNVASGNVSHGVYLIRAANCRIASNHVYENDHPWKARGGINGIRVGNTIYVDPDSTTRDTIEANSIHHNEDSGVEVHGGSRLLIRQNLSWDNNDHGFDHNPGRVVTHIGNVAYHNAHDGLSIEFNDTLAVNSDSVKVFNCIFAKNGWNNDKETRELFVDDTTGFRSHYNVFWNPDTSVANDRWVFRYKGMSSPSKTNWLSVYQGQTRRDSNTVQQNPVFVDAANGNFRLGVASGGIDNATTIIPGGGWPELDILGAARYDVQVASNDGQGSVTYADRGAYERIDTPPGTITDLAVEPDLFGGDDKLVISWTSQGEDGGTGTGTAYDLRYSPYAITSGNFASALQASPQPTPQASGTPQTYLLDELDPCSDYYVAIKTRDAACNWSTISNLPMGTTECGGFAMMEGGGGGGEGGEDLELVDSDGEITVLRIRQDEGGKEYSLRLRGLGSGASLNKVKAYSAVHTSSTLASFDGEEVVLGESVAPTQVKKNGATVTIPESGLPIAAGDTVVATFTEAEAVIGLSVGQPSPSGSEGMELAWKPSGGSWGSAGDWLIRRGRATRWIGSYGPGEFRLVSDGTHRLRWTKGLVLNEQAGTVADVTIDAAQHTSSSDVRSALTSSDGSTASLGEGDTLRITVEVPEIDEGEVCDLFFVLTGTSGREATPVVSEKLGQQVIPARYVLYQNQPNPRRCDDDQVRSTPRRTGAPGDLRSPGPARAGPDGQGVRAGRMVAGMGRPG